MRFRTQCKRFQGGGSLNMVGVRTEQTCSPLLFGQVYGDDETELTNRPQRPAGGR